jgi:hypothetical protein
MVLTGGVGDRSPREYLKGDRLYPRVLHVLFASINDRGDPRFCAIAHWRHERYPLAVRDVVASVVFWIQQSGLSYASQY